MLDHTLPGLLSGRPQEPSPTCALLVHSGYFFQGGLNLLEFLSGQPPDLGSKLIYPLLKLLNADQITYFRGVVRVLR